jgi:predicted Ser/Thr protein kinase
VSVKFTYKGKQVEGTYVEKDSTRSVALYNSLSKFIKDHNLMDPATGRLFRPYHLQNKLRNICEISAKCSEDARIRN